MRRAPPVLFQRRFGFHACAAFVEPAWVCSKRFGGNCQIVSASGAAGWGRWNGRGAIPVGLVGPVRPVGPVGPERLVGMWELRDLRDQWDQ